MLSIGWFQIALSSFYETQQDADIDLGNAADAMDDDDGDDDNINVMVGGASGLHPAHFVADKKADKKSKSKNRAVGGGRIFTLNNMSSSDEDDDENTGQVEEHCHTFDICEHRWRN